MAANKNPQPEPTPRRERRSRTAEGDSKAFAWKLLRDNVEKDPLLRDRFIAQMTGFDIAKARREALEENVRFKFLELGLKELERDPEFAKDMAKEALYEAIGKKPPERPSNEPHPPTFEEMTEHWKRIEDYLKKHGYKEPSAVDNLVKGILDSNILAAIVALIMERVGQTNQSAGGAGSHRTGGQGAAGGHTSAADFNNFRDKPGPTPKYDWTTRPPETNSIIGAEPKPETEPISQKVTPGNESPTAPNDHCEPQNPDKTSPLETIYEPKIPDAPGVHPKREPAFCDLDPGRDPTPSCIPSPISAIDEELKE